MTSSEKAAQPPTHNSNYNFLLGALNIAFSAFAITATIALIKLPTDKTLQLLTKNDPNNRVRDLKITAIYTGFLTYMNYNFGRSCYILYSKNATSTTNKPKEMTPLLNQLEAQGEKEILKIEEINEKKYNPKQEMVNIMLFATGETLMTQISDVKTALAQQNIVYKNSMHNLLQIARSGVGIRFTQAAINLFLLTKAQDNIAHSLFKNKANTVSSDLVSGAISGVCATLLTYPLKQIQTQVQVQTIVNSAGKLIYPHTFTLFKSNLIDLKTQGIIDNLKSIAPKLLLRSVTNAKIFAIVTTLSRLIGPTPIEDIMESGYFTKAKP